MLPPRALPYRDYSVVWTFSPVRDDVLEEVPEALLRVLRDPRTSPYGLVGRRRPAETVARRAIERTPDRLSTDDAIDRLRHSVHAGDPLRVLISPQRVTFAISHATTDGLGIAVLIAAVMTAANGGEPLLDARTPVRHPLLTALREVGFGAVRRFLSQPREDLPIGRPLRRDEAPLRGHSVELRIEPDLLSRIERLPSGGRATPAARLASVAAAALARVDRGVGDVPVFVPVSLLRHVGNRRVAGNFIGIEPIGALHASDWSAAAITSRLAAAATSGRALIGFAYVVLRELRRAALPHRGASDHGRVSVSLQMLSLPNLIPLSAWASAEWTTCAATVGPWPSSTALAPARVGKRWIVSAWDESGRFDLDALPAALLAEVIARESASSELHQ